MATSIGTLMSLHYRLCQADDIQAVRKLWTDNTDWGDYAEYMFNHYIASAPLEGALVTLAVNSDDGEIVGQFAFIPARVKVDEELFKAYRPAAPILAKRYRHFFGSNPLAHPLLGMHSLAIDVMRSNGVSLTYSLPNPIWMTFLRRNPEVRLGKFSLYSYNPNGCPAPTLPSNITATKADLTDPRVDTLWRRFSTLYPCAVVRDSSFLSWKIGKGDDEVIAVEQDGELLAILAMKAKGNQQLLINDLVYAGHEQPLEAALLVAIQSAIEKVSAGNSGIAKVALLGCEPMIPILQKIGFRTDSYNFPFAVRALDPSIQLDSIDPARWYLTAND